MTPPQVKEYQDKVFKMFDFKKSGAALAMSAALLAQPAFAEEEFQAHRTPGVG